MEEAVPAGNVRRSRFWLYTPFVLLLLAAVAWSVAWFVIRNRAGEALDGWLQAEARGGRQWTCQDRRIGGYPFRIEIVCNALSLKQGAVTAAFGRVEAVAQIYQPRRVVAEIDGPLRATDGRVTVQGQWDLLQASVHLAPGGLQRASVAARAPRLTLAGLTPTEIATSGQSLELHLRPNPSRVAERAYDAAFSIRQARVPALDNLVGGAELTDLDGDVTFTQAEGFRGRPAAVELERWRTAGGQLDVLMLAIAKGSRRMEAKGNLRLDEAAGLDGLLGNVTGNRTGGALLGALLGQGPRAPADGAKSQLTPLPPLRLQGGFLSLGPFVIPNIRLQPLY
jgi:hypothetical protein